MTDQELKKKKIVPFLLSLEPFGAGAHKVVDTHTNQMTSISSLLYKHGSMLWTSEDIYHFDKYDDPLPDDVYRWAVEQVTKK